jgi:hypothetical protein
MGWEEHVAYMGVWREAHRILIGKLGRKRPHGRTKRRLGDSIKMYLKTMDWVYEMD